MDFGYVLKRAWGIIWKFKVLWIFGILASCGQSGSSGGSNIQYTFSNQDGAVSPQIERFFASQNAAFYVALICIGILVILAIVILAILLGTIGRIGLIRGTVKAEQGAERLSFGELWRDGLSYFWRVFGLNLLVGVVIFLAILAFILLMIVPTVLTLGLIWIPLICLFVPVMWAVTVIIEQANIALVVENVGITEALKHAWRVVRDNFGSMVVMSLILVLGVGLIGGIIIGLPLLVVGAPLFFGAVSGTTAALNSGLLISGILFLIYLPIMLLLSGILRSYTSSAWTLTYLRLTGKALRPPSDISLQSKEINPPPVLIN